MVGTYQTGYSKNCTEKDERDDKEIEEIKQTRTAQSGNDSTEQAIDIKEEYNILNTREKMNGKQLFDVSHSSGCGRQQMK